MDHLVYMDNAATTPLSESAREAMLPFLDGRYGNPSSLYSIGQDARTALDKAREACAAVLGCRPGEVIFTSGGTESDNAALLGVALSQRARGNHIVTTSIEHHAVLEAAQLLEALGFDVTYVDPQRNGIMDPDAIAAAVRPETSLVSVMLANNEIGTVQPLAAIASAVKARARELGRDIAVHTDAVQAAGALSLKVDDLGVDLLSLSAHKFNGPKGVGLLYLRRGTPFRPTHVGGAQERDRRAGTENVAGIVSMSVALQEAETRRPEYAIHCTQLREKLLAGILERVDGVHVNGDLDNRLPNNVNVSLDGLESEPLLMALDLAGIAASSGSACTAGSLEPSHVLRAMHLPDARSRSSLRLTVSSSTTDDEVNYVVDTLAVQVERIRRLL